MKPVRVITCINFKLINLCVHAHHPLVVLLRHSHKVGTSYMYFQVVQSSDSNAMKEETIPQWITVSYHGIIPWQHRQSSKLYLLKQHMSPHSWIILHEL
jgi:hypothetical protein